MNAADEPQSSADVRRSRLAAKIQEADAALASVEGATLPAVRAGLLDFLPGLGAAIEAELASQQTAQLVTASRRLIEAILAVQEDFLERLKGDPRFEVFVERLVFDSRRAEHREKIDYYARLLTRSAPSTGPDEDERIRLLDVLDGLRPHHLRLFHVFATTEAVGPGLTPEMELPNAIELVSGIPADATRRDLALLERFDLVTSSGWGPTLRPTGELEWTANLRIQLNEFGLLFEAYVAAEHERQRRVWEVEVMAAERDVVRELARDFGQLGCDPRFIRELGGLYLVSDSFESMGDEAAVRESADDALARMEGSRRLESRPAANVRVGIIYERRAGAVIVHRDGGQGDIPHQPPGLKASAPIAAVAGSVASKDSQTAVALERYAVALTAYDRWHGSQNLHDECQAWKALSDAVTALDDDPVRLAVDLELSPDAVEPVVRTAAGCQEDPLTLPDGRMDLENAVHYVRQVLAAWVYARAGIRVE